MNNIATKVEDIVKYCLYNDNEMSEDGSIPKDAIIVDGIMTKMGFHPNRINEKKEEIKNILNEMPDYFHKNQGGGWSFLNLCNDKNDVQWGEHHDMENLVILSIASGYGSYLMPKNMWSGLPGGMPYVVFDTGVVNES